MFNIVQSTQGILKIASVKEFVDSKCITEFLVKEKARQMALLTNHRPQIELENT